MLFSATNTKVLESEGSHTLELHHSASAMEQNQFAALTSNLTNEDELGGLLNQHLSELDESLAALTEAGRLREERFEGEQAGQARQAWQSSQKNIRFRHDFNVISQPNDLGEAVPGSRNQTGRSVWGQEIECLPPPQPPPAQLVAVVPLPTCYRSSPSESQRSDVAACGAYGKAQSTGCYEAQRGPGPGLPGPTSMSASSATNATNATGSRREGREATLESLLRGIETDQLSINDALRSLEKLPMAETQTPSLKDTRVSPPATRQTQTQGAETTRCGQCPILGLQVRALAQSLSGLGASVVKWSTCLVHSRQTEIADMVLEYVQPLKHLDGQLEALCLELTHSLNDLTDLAASSALEMQHDSLDHTNLRQKWRSEAGDSPLTSVLRSPQFLAMDISMDAMRPEEPKRYCSKFAEDVSTFSPQSSLPAWPGQIHRVAKHDTQSDPRHARTPSFDSHLKDSEQSLGISPTELCHPSFGKGQPDHSWELQNQ